LRRCATVTGLQHLIEVNGQRILLESGKRAEACERNRNLPLDPKPFCPNLHLREQGG
jgi:hypothetical protein